MATIQDLYQNDSRMKHFVDHWAAKHHVSKEEIMGYEITRLYTQQLLEKEEPKNEEMYEIRQDNGIT